MPNSSGWIKLYRQIWGNKEIWDTGEPFDKRSAWIDMLMMANHEPKTVNIDGKPVLIRRGQFHTSERKLAERWHWSRNKVRRFLATTNDTTMSTTKQTTNGTTITIENYSVYQGEPTTERTTERTTNRPTNGTQTRRKEEKNTAPGRLERLPASSKDDEDPGAIFA